MSAVIESNENKRLIKGFIMTVGAAVVTASIVGGGSAIYTIITIPQAVSNNRSLIEENKRAISELMDQGREQIKLQSQIVTSVRFIANANDRTNELLTQIVKKQSKVAEIQASRKNVVEDMREHLKSRSHND